jgi:hypothetical protein
MGFFDFFFRRKRQEPTEEDKLKARLQAERPHCHHYTFAHQALREAAFQEPYRLIEVLRSSRATEFLVELWRRVDSHCRMRGERSSINPAEIVVHPFDLAGRPGVVVEMPEPWFVTGAYFVALLLREGDPPEESPLLYFTLEKAVSLDETPRTVFGAWGPDGTHINGGPGPEPTLKAFLTELERRVRTQPRERP